VFRVREVLRTETSANIRRDEPHRRRCDAQRSCRRITIAVDVLAGDLQRVALLFRVIQADGATWLHRIGDDTMIVEPDRYRMRCRCERGIDRNCVTPLPVHANIAGHFVRDLGRTIPPRGVSGGEDRQCVVVHDNALRRVQCLCACRGDNQRHRLANMAHLAGRQQRLRREGEALAGLHVRFQRWTHRL
jgi:hypothetical protein